MARVKAAKREKPREIMPENMSRPLRTVCINPIVTGPDNGEGGVSRVVRAQIEGLERHGWRVVERPEDADVLACHIQVPFDELPDGRRISWAQRYPDKPLVVMNHGFYWEGYEWSPWCYEANRSCTNAIIEADATIAPTEWLANSIRRNLCREVEVIPHGVDLESWTDATPRGYVLWNKTRVDPICDPAPLYDLAELLPDTRFVSTLGVPGRRAPSNVDLRSPGPWEQARHDLLGASAYLCTTRETFGIGTLEALAAGVPVVGFRWAGQAEIMADVPELLALLVEPGDIEALAIATQAALDHHDELAPLCRALAARYTWDPILERYAEVFDRVFVEYEERRRKAVPRTTIIVTAYQLEQYLPDTLDSVLAQTDRDWECVIVDDASPDRCGEIAEEYSARDARFRVIHNDHNLYLAGARNAGITVARGRYILPLDADDKLTPDTVGILADALDADRGTHVAYGAVIFTREDGSLEQYQDRNGVLLEPGHSGWPVPFRFSGGQGSRGKNGRPFNLLPYSSMFRREAWRLTGGYRERCKTAEDAEFWARLSSYGFRPRMVTLAPTLIYRNRATSMSRIQEPPDWLVWFGWHSDLRRAPAGSIETVTPPTVASFDPPALTVVIPVGRGHERIVMDAIDSLEAQSFRRFEVIVVNDSGNPLPPLPAWVRVMETVGRKGPAHARNLAIAAARSDLFLPLDADDLLQPEALREMMATWRELGGIVYSDVWHDSREPESWDYFPYLDYDPANLVKGCLHTVTALTPIDAWREIGGYDEKLPAWEDWAFQVRCMAAGWCSHRVAAPLMTYRMHRGRRREQNIQDKDRAIARFREGYGRYLTEDSIMACGCNSGANTTRAAQSWSPDGSGGGLLAQEGMTLIQYNGPQQGNFTLRGAATGTTYSFAQGDGPKYVYDADVAALLQRPEFQQIDPVAVANGDGPTLVSSRPMATV